jgi:hypothetical protein
MSFLSEALERIYDMKYPKCLWTVLSSSGRKERECPLWKWNGDRELTSRPSALGISHRYFYTEVHYGVETNRFVRGFTRRK